MPQKKILNIAHRGARAHAPENTLAAARLAHSLGADMWELDTALTSDGHLVVVHDDTLERTTDVAKRREFADRAPWRLESFTLEEVRSLDAGSWFGETDPFGTVASGEVTFEYLAAYAGEKIPTLEEALDLVKNLGWLVNVEIKDHSQGIWHKNVTGKVMEMIRHCGLEASVVVSSFQHEYLREAKALAPSVARGALAERCIFGVEPQSGRDAGLAVVKSLSPDEAAAICRAVDATFFHPDLAFLDAGFAAAVQEKGFPINVWTVNSPNGLKRMLKYGVHGIITDFPGRLKKLMALS